MTPPTGSSRDPSKTGPGYVPIAGPSSANSKSQATAGTAVSEANYTPIPPDYSVHLPPAPPPRGVRQFLLSGVKCLRRGFVGIANALAPRCCLGERNRGEVAAVSTTGTVPEIQANLGQKAAEFLSTLLSMTDDVESRNCVGEAYARLTGEASASWIRTSDAVRSDSSMHSVRILSSIGTQLRALKQNELEELKSHVAGAWTAFGVRGPDTDFGAILNFIDKEIDVISQAKPGKQPLKANTSSPSRPSYSATIRAGLLLTQIGECLSPLSSSMQGAEFDARSTLTVLGEASAILKEHNLITLEMSVQDMLQKVESVPEAILPRQRDMKGNPMPWTLQTLRQSLLQTVVVSDILAVLNENVDPPQARRFFDQLREPMQGLAEIEVDHTPLQAVLKQALADLPNLTVQNVASNMEQIAWRIGQWEDVKPKVIALLRSLHDTARKEASERSLVTFLKLLAEEPSRRNLSPRSQASQRNDKRIMNALRELERQLKNQDASGSLIHILSPYLEDALNRIPAPLLDATHRNLQAFDATLKQRPVTLQSLEDDRLYSFLSSVKDAVQNRVGSATSGSSGHDKSSAHVA